MIIDVITIFPQMFTPILAESIIKRAQAKGLLKIKTHDLRDYTSDDHKRVDAPGYGGGGMVFAVAPIVEAVESLLTADQLVKKDKTKRVILFNPRGRTLNQKMIRNFLQYERLILLAPRYEGVDERVMETVVDEEISLGDYVLSGGELAAMVFIDCLARLIPGVVSDQKSINQESFENNLLDYPSYTRPENFRGIKVPEILLSGNHKKIEEWRKNKAREITKKNRPDILEQ
jgi:tRNA (guanine37-N1)-methyltransferase